MLDIFKLKKKKKTVSHINIFHPTFNSKDHFDTRLKGWGPIWHSWKVRDQFDTKSKGWGPKWYLNLCKIIMFLWYLIRFTFELGYWPFVSKEIEIYLCGSNICFDLMVNFFGKTWSKFNQISHLLLFIYNVCMGWKSQVWPNSSDIFHFFLWSTFWLN